MDGVLVDVSGSYRRAVVETAEEYIGRELPSDTVQLYKNRGGFNDDWELTYAIIQDHHVPASFDDVVDSFQERYRGRSFDGLIATETAIIKTEALRQLKRLATLGIVTGRPKAEALWTISNLGWDGIFEVVVAREDQDGLLKPDKHPLLKALKILKDGGLEHPPAESAYVGDSVDDIRAAVAARFRPIGFVPSYLSGHGHEEVLREAGARVVLTDLSDLTQMFTVS